MSSSILLNAFNNQLTELFVDIINIFPDNIDIKTAQNSIGLIKKSNPKLTIKIWKTFIVEKYGDKFDSEDISFFIEKDYSEDLSNIGSSNNIMEAVDRIREPIKLMNPSDQKKTMKYFSNLNKLCCLYHELI